MINYNAKHRKKFYILIGITVTLIMLCVLGAVWNAVSVNAERNEYPPTGLMVDVFDTKMHVFSSGTRTEGEPAIVLISGLSTPSPTADFYPIWSRLDDKNHVIVLERPGYGWSQSTKRERSLKNIVEEDRTALQQAGIKPPYVLVAHSIGGLDANMFSTDYPDEVQSVVLIDCTSPETMLSYKNSVPILNRIVPAIRSIGLLRLVNAINPDILENISSESRNGFAALDAYNKKLDEIFVLQKYQDSMMLKEQEMRMKNAESVKDKPFPANVPVSLIIAVQSGNEDHPQYQEFMKAQEAWVNRNGNGHVTTLTGSHYLHHYAPDEVCDIISSMTKGK